MFESTKKKKEEKLGLVVLAIVLHSSRVEAKRLK
jgi:hypothetical protein